MEQDNLKQFIFENLSRMKYDREFIGFGCAKNLEIIGDTFGVEKLEYIFQNRDLLSLLSNPNHAAPPIFVVKFIEELIMDSNNMSIIDPWLTFGSPALYIKPKRLTGICYNQSLFTSFKSLLKDEFNNYVIKFGEPVEELTKMPVKFDIVLCFPPFNLNASISKGANSNFDFATNLLLACGRAITNDGKLIFLVASSFLVNDKGKEALKKNGLFVEAVFSIPRGECFPKTNISTYIILVSKNFKERTFVAEISHDAGVNRSIIKNFKSQKEAKVIKLGCFVDFSEFKSLRSFSAERELIHLGNRIGYPKKLLSEIALAINPLKVPVIGDVIHLENSIYCPKNGTSLVKTSPGDLKGAPKNYYQIQLDETKANSIYLANYLNSQIGKWTREYLATGAEIPHITKSNLLKCNLFLPDLTTQIEIIEIDNKIQQYSFKIDELRRSLWKQPRNCKAFEKELKSIIRSDKLEDWIDKLPFPISSILWRYYATNDNVRRIEHLFHFFEAFSEFISMLMLSSLVQNREFYYDERHNWITKDEKFDNWYLRASFGNWNNLSSSLSKAIRTYLNNNEKKEFCKNLFGNPNDAFLLMLTSKELMNVLINVASQRNKWKGHGGITNDCENSRRVVILEHHLNELRNYIGEAFDEIRVVSPLASTFEDGVFTYNVKELIGARTPFNEISIKSLIGLDRKKLYLITTQLEKPIELLPFIKFNEESDAVYFYTSIESKDVRWVSYHFDKEAELQLPVDKALFETFELLKQ